MLLLQYLYDILLNDLMPVFKWGKKWELYKNTWAHRLADRSQWQDYNPSFLGPFSHCSPPSFNLMPKVYLFQLLWRVKDSVPSEYIEEGQAQLFLFFLPLFFHWWQNSAQSNALLCLIPTCHWCTNNRTLQEHRLTQIFPAPARKRHTSVPSRSSHLITIWLALNDS